MILTDPWLTQSDTQALFELFEDAGHQIYCVGGCVRNALLGERVADIDMATDARPEQMMELAQRAGLRTIPTGIEHGTITILSGETSFEVTTFRNDVSTDGRRARVAFSDSLEEDAHRRDLTINALYVGADGIIIDPVGGLPDLKTHHIRFIGDAATRIAEDYLRILRFFRFYAFYGDPDQGIDADGLAACADGACGLEQLSAERIGAEMRKLLSAPNPAPAIGAMQHAGVLARIMPGADAASLAVLVHLEAWMPPDWKRRALMLAECDLKERWRLSNQDAKLLQEMRHSLDEAHPLNAIAFHHGADHARTIAYIRAARAQQPVPDTLENEIDKASRAVFPVTAQDLMPAYEGAALGERLRTLENRWIASEFTATREELLA